jgi:hypothetical protein
VTVSGHLLAHGVSSRQDLPIPFGYALGGAAVALVVSFLALGLLWREPRLRPATAGVALPDVVARFLVRRSFRVALRVFGLLATIYVGIAAVFGRDDALNPTAGTVFVLFWVGLPLLSVIAGPVWRMVSPVRSVHRLVALVMRTPPTQGVGPRYARRLGYWPAAATLLVFTWLELVYPENTELRTLRTAFLFYLAVNVLAATYWGSRWFGRGDGFEVFSTLVGRMSPLGRRPADGRLVLRDPLSGVAGTPIAPGLFAVVGTLLGSTLYDSFSSSPWWVVHTQELAVDRRVIGTLSLVATVIVITSLFAGAAALSGRGAGLVPQRARGEFAHTLVPIVIGYLLAHYWSLLVLIGQQTVIQLSDPLGNGSNWLGTGGRGIDPSLATPALVAVLQVCSVVVGHVLGVVLAHDRAVALLPRNRAIVGQLPMLALMVTYTVVGLTLLFAG